MPNHFSPPFFSDSKKIDEFHHAKKVLPENPISSLVVKWNDERGSKSYLLVRVGYVKLCCDGLYGD